MFWGSWHRTRHIYIHIGDSKGHQLNWHILKEWILCISIIYFHFLYSNQKQVHDWKSRFWSAGWIHCVYRIQWGFWEHLCDFLEDLGSNYCVVYLANLIRYLYDTWRNWGKVGVSHLENFGSRHHVIPGGHGVQLLHDTWSTWGAIVMWYQGYRRSSC
jgi:hypothetical protein